MRKPGDYVAKMITMAGGTYVPQSAEEEEENALFYHEYGNGSLFMQRQRTQITLFITVPLTVN